MVYEKPMMTDQLIPPVSLFYVGTTNNLTVVDEEGFRVPADLTASFERGTIGSIVQNG